MQIDFDTHVAYVSALQLNSYRALRVAKNGGAENFLFRCWGGLGDKVCAEPTIRWAFENIPYKRFAIATSTPELFEHIKCEKIKVSNDGLRGDWNPTLWYELLTIVDQSNPDYISPHFFKHLLTQAVDYVSLQCFGMQLPTADREIKLPNFETPEWDFWKTGVVVHAGKHWASKTFPADWWVNVCEAIVSRGLTPILIGREVDENVGYVDFKAPTGCIDFRNEMSLSHLVGLLQRTCCLISNDSSPIHIAASGNAWIGVIATCKHPDYISHWRKGRWQWRFKNLSRDGLYNHYNLSPFQNFDSEENITTMDIKPEFLAKCLPDPEDVASFAKVAVDDYWWNEGKDFGTWKKFSTGQHQAFLQLSP